MNPKCLLILLGGWSLVALGVVVFPLPIPLGIVLVSLGLGVLVPCSTLARRLLQRLSQRWERVLSRWRN